MFEIEELKKKLLLYPEDYELIGKIKKLSKRSADFQTYAWALCFKKDCWKELSKILNLRRKTLSSVNLPFEILQRTTPDRKVPWGCKALYPYVNIININKHNIRGWEEDHEQFISLEKVIFSTNSPTLYKRFIEKGPVKGVKVLKFHDFPIPNNLKEYFPDLEEIKSASRLEPQDIQNLAGTAIKRLTIGISPEIQGMEPFFLLSKLEELSLHKFRNKNDWISISLSALPTFDKLKVLNLQVDDIRGEVSSPCLEELRVTKDALLDGERGVRIPTLKILDLSYTPYF